MDRIPLSNAAFEGDNNAYLFADGEETVLIDTGDWTDATRDQLAGALSERDVAFSDVDRIVLTHWHPDHVGLAGTIQAESGADVYVHEADAALVEGDETAWAELFDLQEQYFEQWGIPEDDRATLREILVNANAPTEHPTVTPIVDGETLAFDDTELRVVHASGHAAGLCLFEMDADGHTEAFTGDALLPVYTPNVGGADVRVDAPLETYLRALARIVDADYHRAWPGHRDPIDEPADRAAHIIYHHEERAYRVLDALDRLESADTWTVSADLFGELNDIHILHGPGECYAHLDHLDRAGLVVCEGNEYRLAEGVSDDLAATEGDQWPLTIEL